jgi:predicted ATPase
MYITRLKLKNWRNFTEVDIPLRETALIIGPNASGKSNLLDALRFLRDVAMPRGGGLQKAIDDRNGVPKIRCLAARKNPEIELLVELSSSPDDSPIAFQWRYELAFKNEASGHKRNLITRERVKKRGVRGYLLSRPSKEDKEDPELLTQTALENMLANSGFREIAHFLSGVTYLHLVPQLLRHRELFSYSGSDGDPFGQNFLERIAKASEKTRERYLKSMEEALNLAVPQLKTLKFVKDEMGHPHLQARYQHWRPKGAKQWEDQFSDGTLRLVGLLWCLLEGYSPLLLEEPELSLNEAIIERIPILIERMQRKRDQQVFITTHSYALLSNPGIDGRQLVFLEPKSEGTEVRGISKEEATQLQAGLSLAEIMLPKARAEAAERMAPE